MIKSFLSASDVPIGTAALYALVGFVIVLIVLALLVGIFYLVGFIFRTKALSGDKLFDFKGKKQTEVKDPEIVPDVTVNADDETETVAAITAAISVILSEETGSSAPDFVIRRVTRKK